MTWYCWHDWCSRKVLARQPLESIERMPFSRCPARLPYRSQIHPEIVWRRSLTWSIIAARAVTGSSSLKGRRFEVADLKKGSRITGVARDKLASDLKKKYEKGASIRALAESTGRSYGFVHRVLSESGVTLRGRGGATRTKKK